MATVLVMSLEPDGSGSVPAKQIFQGIVDQAEIRARGGSIEDVNDILDEITGPLTNLAMGLLYRNAEDLDIRRRFDAATRSW